LAAGIKSVEALKLGSADVTRDVRESNFGAHQSPKSQIPKPKLQRNSNPQTPKRVVGEYWSLGFLWDLVLGIWNLQEL
jgi:hypothetical protein